MFDWTITPHSRIDKLRVPLLQKVALLVRNLQWTACQLFHRVPYVTSLRKVQDELEMAVDYIISAGVRGDIAEFGSHGRSAKAICKTLKLHHSSRGVHLFDSFQGFPKVESREDLDSPHVKDNVWPEGGSAPCVSPERLRREMLRYIPDQQLEIYEGWFKDTLVHISESTVFAMVHVDCDLYESTIQVLMHLFNRRQISEGCVILFDDWNCNLASPEYGERKAWADIVSRHEVQFSDAGSYGWGGHKVIVHAYRPVEGTSDILPNRLEIANAPV